MLRLFHEHHRYRSWLFGALARPHTPLTLTCGAGTDLVLGAATNAAANDVAVFVKSLRAVSTCHAVLIVDPTPEMIATCAAHDVDAVHIDPSQTWAPHPRFSRYSTALGIVRAVAGQVERVFFLDTADVVFQADPFQAAGEGISFFDEGRPFAASTWNRRRMRATAGKAMEARMMDRPVICSGTVVASRALMENYIAMKLFVAGQMPAASWYRAGLDQCSTNVIAHEAMLPGITIHTNNGLVATIVNDDYTTDDSGYIRNPNGAISPIAHQYDRHPHLYHAVRHRFALDDKPTRNTLGETGWLERKYVQLLRGLKT